MPEQQMPDTPDLAIKVSDQTDAAGVSPDFPRFGPAFPINSDAVGSDAKGSFLNRMKSQSLPRRESGKDFLKVAVISLAGQEQAIEVDLVEEIIMEPHIAPLIKAPFFVDGVMRLRGKIVPVVDLKKAMRLPEHFTSSTHPVVIMVRLWGRRIGFKVDFVRELLAIPMDSIEQPKGIVGELDSRFMKGLAYVGDRLVIVLDLESMLSEDQEMILQDERNMKDLAESDESLTVERKLSTRRIISFILDREIYGVEMGEVAEIRELTPIMPVPNVADHVLGLMNLRGTIMPVIDLRILFGLERKPWTGESRIVIMKEKNLLVGVIVDSMWESLRISNDNFQPAPQGVTKIDVQYFRDISLVNGRVVSVLDIARILSDTAEKNQSTLTGEELLLSESRSKQNLIAGVDNG